MFISNKNIQLTKVQDILYQANSMFSATVLMWLYLGGIAIQEYLLEEKNIHR